MDLINELNTMNTQLKKSLKQLRENGIKLAEAEKNYKIAVNKKALQLKDMGTPVTLIQLIIYGYEDIADLRFKRDSANSIYQANLEAINCLKLQIRIVNEQINKEWSNNE